jgi:tetratricopeptide (TPR) repeat protein
MKRVLLLAVITLISSLMFGQEKQDVRGIIDPIGEPVQIIESRRIYLASGSRSLFEGTSRTFLKIDLPPNTVKWYYSFSTSEGISGTQNINLFIQLAGLLNDPSGITSGLISKLKVPKGVASADIFLCDRPNIDLFLEKAYSFNYTMEGSVQNHKQAVVEIDDITTGTVFLGLRNPSVLDGIIISIEVVAITDEIIADFNRELEDRKNKAISYGNLGWIEFENGNYRKCIRYCNKSNVKYTLGWVQANKGLALLMIGRQSKARETYVNAITLIKKQPNPNYVFEEIIKDIDNVLKINPNLNGANEVKRLIQLQQ